MFSGKPNLSLSFLPPFSVGVHTYREEFAPDFFSPFELIPIWKGFISQGSKQEVTKVAFFHQNAELQIKEGIYNNSKI